MERHSSGAPWTLRPDCGAARPAPHWPPALAASLAMTTSLLRAALVLGLLLAPAAQALDQTQAASGVKEALAQGVESAIAQLGKPDGFLKDEAVKIRLPGKLKKVAETARSLGQGKYVDQLETTMNRAAEAAVPAAAEIFGDAIRTMSVQDAFKIVGGGEHAATDYFRSKSGTALRAKLLPIVTRSTAESGVGKSYKRLLDKSGGLLGKLAGDQQGELDLDGYVTDKALDGLYHYIGQKEAAIRKNPLGTGSSLLKSVFGR